MRSVILCLFLSLWMTPSLCAEGIIIGIAEDSQHEVTPFHARIMFKQTHSGWLVLNSKLNYQKADLANEQTWTIAFDGKNLGQLSTIDVEERTPSCEWCFSRDKVSKLKDIGEFPKLGNREQRFQNWLGIPKNRPVVLNSQPFYKDHESWKRLPPKDNLLGLIYPNINQILGGLAEHCTGAPKWDVDTIKLTIDDVEVFRVYGNITQELIVSAGVAAKHLKDCDGLIADVHGPIWFYVKEDNVTLIGYELDLVEAGDFDNDGEIEFIFAHSGINRDGYSLFESGFRSRYDYFWGYH